MTRESVISYFRKCGYSRIKFTGLYRYKPETFYELPLLSENVIVCVLRNNIEIRIDAPLGCRMIGLSDIRNGKELMDKIKHNVKIAKSISANKNMPTDFDYIDV